MVNIVAVIIALLLAFVSGWFFRASFSRPSETKSVQKAKWTDSYLDNIDRLNEEFIWYKMTRQSVIHTVEGISKDLVPKKVLIHIKTPQPHYHPTGRPGLLNNRIVNAPDHGPEEWTVQVIDVDPERQPDLKTQLEIYEAIHGEESS